MFNKIINWLNAEEVSNSMGGAYVVSLFRWGFCVWCPTVLGVIKFVDYFIIG